MKLKKKENEEEATHLLKIHKKVGYREIEMLKVAYFRYLKKSRMIELYSKDLYLQNTASRLSIS